MVQHNRSLLKLCYFLYLFFVSAKSDTFNEEIAGPSTPSQWPKWLQKIQDYRTTTVGFSTFKAN